ncbi:MAG: DUF885 domain-containing protein [Anaerolineae bacterium]
MTNGDSGARTASSQLQQLLADEWEVRMQDDPLFATRCGDHRFDDRLPAVSEDDFQRRLAQARVFLDRLQEIDRSALTPSAQLNYDMFEHEMRDRIAEYEFGAYLMPMTKASGLHRSFPDLLNIAPLDTLEDYENYVARLAAFQAFAQAHIELMRAGIRRGYVPPRVVLEGIEDSIQAHVVQDPTESVLFKPFEQLPESITETDQRDIIQAGRAAIVNSVVPGYQALLQFMLDEYIPAGREDIAASSLPDGRAFYEHRVRKNTTLDLTPQQVHDIGLEEVRRIRDEMDDVIRRVDFQGGFREFVHFLRTDERFYVDTPEALMKEVALIMKKMDGQLPRLFKKLPRTPYGLRQIPDHIAPKTTSAYYFPAAGDGTKVGFYYVNTYDLKSRPLYEYEALSLHEAVPGHHLQLALQMELDLPDFRRFGGITAFIEGWALYAERLGLEAGFYQDPYSDFGRLTFEMWRACRLVVDTGMHYLGWTRQQAIDFMVENTALSLLNITNEVDRYISWPGQALAYKIGEIKIRELRTLAEHALGPRFDVREFHRIILENGGIPLDVLEANVKRWMAEQADVS